MGGNTLRGFQGVVGIRCRYFRNLQRLVESDRFKEYYERLSEKERSQVEIDLMQAWAIERVRKKMGTGEKTFLELREEASVRGIVGYSRLTKSQLEKALKEAHG